MESPFPNNEPLMFIDSPQRRVVITGIGVLTPNGADLSAFWKTIVDGESAAGSLTRFDPGEMKKYSVAAEIQGFNGADYVGAKRAKRLDLSTQYAIAASLNAVRDAKISLNDLDADRVGVVEGISLGGTETTLKGQTALLCNNYRAINAYSLINGYTGAGSGEIALELGSKGHAVTLCSSSASGNDSIGYALRMIQDDDADVMIAGGCEAPLLPALWAVFCVNRVMTSQNESPKTAMKPYDRHRDGFVLGEGGAYLVLEELSFALDRGAPIYAEVLSQARSCEAYHSVAPHPDGLGVTRAMEKALRRARIDPSEIDYINSHGTATDANDLVETRSIKHVFKNHAKKVAISSTKPITGHLMGAAGAVETAVCALAIKNRMIPPTINLTEPEDECDLDYVVSGKRPYPVRIAMNINAGFGGKNSCLILREFSRKAP